MLNDQHHYSYLGALEIIHQMTNDLIGEPYPCVCTMDFDLDTDVSSVGYGSKEDESVGTRSYPRMNGVIGVQELFNAIDDKKHVRDVDLVWIGKHICHEARHLYQLRTLYQQDGLVGEMLDMVRIDALMNTFNGYWSCVYPYAPFELDADIYGFKGAVEYFDKYLLNDDGKPIVNTKQCLVQRTYELDNLRGQYIPYGLDYDGIIQYLSSHMQDYKFLSRGYDSNDILNQKDWIFWKDELNKCPRGLSFVNEKNKIGVEYDEKLFSLLLDVNSTWVDLHKGLDKEVKRIRKLYPSELGIADRFANTSSRFINTRDENRRELESKIFAMGTDLDKKLNANMTIDYHL